MLSDAFEHENYKSDFTLFDGNSQGFRIATVLNGWKYNGGLRLSAASLAAMVKYPYSSSDKNGKSGKFGYMSSESEYFYRVFRECGLSVGPQRS